MYEAMIINDIEKINFQRTIEGSVVTQNCCYVQSVVCRKTQKKVLIFL